MWIIPLVFHYFIVIDIINRFSLWEISFSGYLDVKGEC